MKKITVVSGDAKLISDVTKWLKDLTAENEISIISSFAEFAEKFYQKPDANPKPPEDPAKDPAAEVNPDDENGQAVLADLVIFDQDFLKGSPAKKLEEARLAIRLLPEAKVYFILLAYENAKITSHDFISPAIDDLLMKPLDRDLFLQKMEMMLSDNHSAQSLHLFKQKTQMVIEMAKESDLDGMSEYGVAIHNPKPLKAGVYARLHSSMFGVGPNSALLARVYGNRKHPQVPGTYLTYFSFFGLNSVQLSNVRKVIQKANPRAAHSKPIDQAELRLAKMGPKKQILVIERNEKVVSDLKEIFEQNFVNAQVNHVSSYSTFLKQIMDAAPPSVPAASSEVQADSAPAAVASDHIDIAKIVESKEPVLPAQEMTLTLNGLDFALLRMDPALKEDQTILGHKSDDLISSPQRWLSWFDKERQTEIDEFLHYVRAGQASSVQVPALTTEGKQAYLSLSGNLQKSGEADGSSLIQLVLSEIPREEWHLKNPKAGVGKLPFTEIDALYLDASLIRGEVDSWLIGFQELLQKVGLWSIEKNFPIFVMRDEGSLINMEGFRHKGISDFIQRPLDRRIAIQKATIFVKDLVPSTSGVPSEFAPLKDKIYVAKDVEMEEIAEYGLQIKTRTAFRPDTFLHFFSPLFLQGKDSGVLARCSSCAEDANTKGTFHCFFSFYGVSDADLKHIRTWIREDYVAKKEKS